MRKFILIMVLFITFYFKGSNSFAQPVIMVDDDLDFFRVLPMVLENNYPLVYSDKINNHPLEHFIQLYEGNIETFKNILDQENFETKDKIIISNSSDKRIMAMDAHISYKLNARFILDIDIEKSPNLLESLLIDNKEIEVIFLGEVGIDFPFIKRVQRFISYEQVFSYYERIFEKTNLTVFIENDEMLSLGTYLAGYRDGMMIFELESANIKSKQYFAWLVTPMNFSPDRLKYIYDLLDENGDGINDRGMGVITGKNLQQANLLLLRSFFYEKISKTKHLLVVDTESKSYERNANESQWTYTLLGGNKANKNAIIEEIQRATYIKFVAHGSPESFLLGDGSYLNAKNMPLLNSVLFIAESCETAYLDTPNNIALDIVEKGAVAYVGSYKNGGVTHPLFGGQFSHLLTTESIPLSDLIAFHNQGIVQYIEEIPRAFLIGDPKWGMFKESGKWVYNKYKYDILPNFGEKILLPVKLDAELNKRGVIIRNPNEINKTLEKPRTRIKDDYGRRNIYILTGESSGLIEFIDSIPISVKFTELILFFINGFRFLQGELFLSSLIILILMSFSGTVLYYVYYNYKLSKTNVILPMIISIIFVLIIDYFILNLRIYLWKYIYYSICFYIGFKQNNIMKGIILLNLLFIVPVLLILRLLHAISNLYLLTLGGVVIINGLFILTWYLAVILHVKKDNTLKEKFIL